MIMQFTVRCAYEFAVLILVGLPEASAWTIALKTYAKNNNYCFVPWAQACLINDIHEEWVNSR